MMILRMGTMLACKCMCVCDNDATYLIITKGYESFYYYQIMRDLVLLYKDARSSIMMILRMGTMHACKCMCVCVHMCMYICTHAFMCGTCGICVEVSMCAKWKCVWVISMCVCVLGMWDGSFDVYMCVCASVWACPAGEIGTPSSTQAHLLLHRHTFFYRGTPSSTWAHLLLHRHTIFCIGTPSSTWAHLLLHRHNFVYIGTPSSA